MSEHRFSAAQLRALLWLPSDGTWSAPPPRSISAALSSPRLYFPELVLTAWHPGNGRLLYALTKAGIAEQAKRDASERKPGA